MHRKGRDARASGDRLSSLSRDGVRTRGRTFSRITCDSRETVPLTLALFVLAGGDLERCVTYAANLGRDADTIASMCGAIAGALGGVDRIREDWVAKAQALSSVDQQDLAARLARTARAKHQKETEARALFASISGMR